MTRQELLETLEKAVDGADIAVVVDMLAEISREKAEHLRANWQDGSTAAWWDRTAGLLDKLYAKIG